MTATGGSVDSVNIKGREFAAAADADTGRKLGGFENAVEQNGGPTGRLIKTRISGMLTGVQVEVDDGRGDQEFLQGIADGTDFVAFSITYVSGLTYQGNGTIAGEMAFSSQNATATFDIHAPGGLTQQE